MHPVPNAHLHVIARLIFQFYKLQNAIFTVVIITIIIIVIIKILFNIFLYSAPYNCQLLLCPLQ